MRKKRRAEVIELIKQELNSYTITDNCTPLPIGYNPIEIIRDGLFHWIAVPFNGIDVWCQLRCPNATQIEQCGDMTNIIDDDNKKLSYEDLIKTRNYQEEICKIVFNKPTFDNILTLVGNEDFVISEKKAKLEEITKFYEENINELSEVEKKTLDLQIKTINLQIGYILPDDTMAFVCKWAMGNDVSDIKKITKDNLLRAASLAKAHSKAPSEYLSGVFTDFNKNEIDTYAFTILDEFMQEKRIVEGGKHRWLLGGRKNTNVLPKKPGGK